MSHQTTNNGKNEKEPRWGWWMLGVTCFVLVVFVLIGGVQYWFVENYLDGGDRVTRFGISGDFFGFTNALFSALAFAMIIVTLWMQKYELRQQREEIDQTQGIMERQQSEMKHQNDSLRQQTFENTFFNMLSLHTEIVAAVRSGDGKTSGRRSFASFLDDLAGSKVGEDQCTTKPAPVDMDDYEKWYLNNEAEAGHYFRSLYNMLRYIDDQGSQQKRMYARLVRGQLSSNELRLLFYSGLGSKGRDKMKPLIEKFAVLKHLPPDAALTSLKSQYQPSAFDQVGQTAER
jgi:hypothetical protein